MTGSKLHLAGFRLDMALKIVCSGFIIRHPVGGHTWHHLQYLAGLARLGHEVVYFEDFGWANSCFDPSINSMTASPNYGLRYMRDVFHQIGLQCPWAYLAEDGSCHGMTREELAECCRKSDLYLNLSNINWVPELDSCRRRVLVDTDPAFTQIGAHGAGGDFSRYHVLLTYGENVGQTGSSMPTAGHRWFPTRQPIVLDFWSVSLPSINAPYTTLINWTAIPDQYFEGRLYGQKDREFASFFDFPQRTGERMEIAVSGPLVVKKQLEHGGWRLAEPSVVASDPWKYQDFIRGSRAEFCVAKHGYVSTNCGWFSDRSCAYLASGRPVVVQDTGFSRNLPCGEGLIAFKAVEEAVDGLQAISAGLSRHSHAARRIAETYFDSGLVLNDLLEKSLS
jgi:hypothetical protein